MIGSFRVLHRGRRAPLAVLELARLLAAGRPKVAPAVDLGRLAERIWRRHGGRVWAVADLRVAHLVERADTHRIGRELSKAWRRGERVGRFTLVRVDVDSRDGAIWRLEV